MVKGIIGIYKITSPTGRIYIGQSVDIKRRLNAYRILNCKDQHKIYNSLKKYGYNNHITEVVERCEVEILNERERFWMEHYNSHSKNHLNCALVRDGDNSGFVSEETRKRMSVGIKAAFSLNPRPKKVKIKVYVPRELKIERQRIAALNRSPETNRKIGEANRRRVYTAQMKKNLGHRKGVILSDSHKSKIRMNATRHAAKIVLNLETGIYYEGSKEAAFSINKKKNHLSDRFSGKIKENNTPFRQV